MPGKAIPITSIPITGEVGGISETDAARLSVVAVVGNTVLATAQLRPDGRYRLNVPAEAARAESAFALQVAVLPGTAAAAPDRVADAPRVTISPADLAGDEAIAAPDLAVDPALIDRWAIFWREWCVSGTVLGPDGCPAPGADVTVYTVFWSTGGYTEVARATAATGPDGTFALCFPWWELLLPCWPCEPLWWRCWPWWWEFDILHVIEALETRATSGPQSVALFQPEGNALIRGQGFPAAATAGVIMPDPARTALIERKFRDPAFRELFPWWWWCCDQPNIVFGVTQGGTTILAPDPATQTRWCMASGQTVTLTGDKATLTCCPGGPTLTSGYVWTSVGTILTSSIDSRGLAQDSGDNTDVAFQGSLWLYASVAPDAFDYYQVNGSVWNAPGFRGGAKPPAAVAPAQAPVYAPLYLPAWTWDTATGMITSFQSVKMGPFTANGYSGLYATPTARATLPAPPGLPALTIPAGNEVAWGYEGLVLTVQDTTLLGGIPFGAVDLTLLGFDQNFNPVAVSPDEPLTLAIDSTPMTLEQVGTITAWTAPGVPAPQTGYGDCPAYDVGPSGFVEVPVTVQDTNGFLCQYELEAQFGHGHSPVVSPPGLRGYATNPTPGFPPDPATASWQGGTETMIFPGSSVQGAPADCCYEFRLYYVKRVTNGFNWPAYDLAEGDFQTISLKFSS
jgi:hypothetical protein